MSAWTLTSSDTLAPGRRVVRRLAGGTAHEAYLVECGGLHGRAVAKLPRPHLVRDPHCLIGLRDEGRALERLAHPGIPRHVDTVLLGPHPHVLMEHVPGPTLRDAIAMGTRLGPPVVASLGAAIADVLDHIARAGWVHLDVKPSNIVLDVRPRLIDFEIARPAEQAARMTQPAGTLAYMPPEQRRAGGDGGEWLAPPADVFALAASLHEALAGRQLITPSVRDAATLRGPVGAVLHDALAPLPGDRPTASELCEALDEWAEPQPWGLPDALRRDRPPAVSGRRAWRSAAGGRTVADLRTHHAEAGATDALAVLAAAAAPPTRG
jgi:eukaryotic-like serine/threonine-protein kinase